MTIHQNTLLISILLLLLLTAATWASAVPKPKSPPRRSPVVGTDGITYAVINRADTNTPGGAVFINHIGTTATQQAMSSATHFIWNLFNQTTCPSDRKNIKKITLFIECMKTGGSSSKATAMDAYTGKNNDIHVNASFIGKYKGNIRREFVGIVYHQMASVWQWNGKGEAPKGLLSGIAEFVRMEAHYGTSEKVRPGDGNRWDQGDGVTARFLEYCEKKKKGFVKDMNKKMRYGYTKAYFVDFLGKTVDQLWKEYKAKYANKY
ncbi:hypothetical protein LINPERPRIM_LOCUS20185 [Linum perenne]